MKEDKKVRGALFSYMQWPILLSVLVICANIAVQLVSRQAGIVMFAFTAIYLICAGTAFFFSRKRALAELVAFAAEKTAQDELVKAAILHFALAYLHPYFDGNGRMARLLHLWYLVQQGYTSALFVPMSRFIEESRSRYYKAYTLAEQNQQISGVLDVTPFLTYFAESVYSRLGEGQPQPRTLQAFDEALRQGKVTEKERALWQFVLTAYVD